jgi:hypothetical protein
MDGAARCGRHRPDHAPDDLGRVVLAVRLPKLLRQAQDLILQLDDLGVERRAANLGGFGTLLWFGRILRELRLDPIQVLGDPHARLKRTTAELRIDLLGVTPRCLFDSTGDAIELVTVAQRLLDIADGFTSRFPAQPWSRKWSPHQSSLVAASIWVRKASKRGIYSAKCGDTELM